MEKMNTNSVAYTFQMDFGAAVELIRSLPPIIHKHCDLVFFFIEFFITKKINGKNCIGI